MAGTIASCGEAMESTPLEETVAPDAAARAMISDALPRMTVGFNLSSWEQVVLRKVVAPTPTGSKTQGWLASLADCIAVSMASTQLGSRVPMLMRREEQSF